MSYKDTYLEWRSKVPADSHLYADLLRIENNEKEMEERFYAELGFGTAGLRGKVGAGIHMMNEYTVGRATQGLANYIRQFGQKAMDRGVVIAHDPRHFSKEFSQMAAGILAANGIKAYTFPDLRPTPELACMVRKLHTISGINITASHNPKEYNGYKVYWEDGCQVSSDIADGIEQQIMALDYFTDIRYSDFDEGVGNGMITVLGSEYDREYLDMVESLAIHSGDELDLSIPLVYTPLNGAGSVPFAQMMEDRGFTNWHIVPEQKDPDPDFTTVGYPNPESPAAFRMSEELGRKVGAELLMATDPDSDRFAIEIRDDSGNYIPLNGNQTGVLLVNYILEGHRTAGTLPENGAMVKSIVTGNMSTAICEAYGVKMFESLTGFKNICGRIPYLQEEGYTYLFGYEESVGYAAHPEIRDKDGISAGMLVAEAAAYYRKQGKTLWNVLEELYDTYGAYAELEPNLILEGLDGIARVKRIMAWLRENPLQSAAGIRVEKDIDFRNGYKDIPPSNVLKYILEDGSWFVIRPSGTEPKLKFYFYTKKATRAEALAADEAIRDDILKLIETIE